VGRPVTPALLRQIDALKLTYGGDAAARKLSLLEALEDRSLPSARARCSWSLTAARRRQRRAAIPAGSGGSPPDCMSQIMNHAARHGQQRLPAARL